MQQKFEDTFTCVDRIHGQTASIASHRARAWVASRELQVKIIFYSLFLQPL